MAGQSYFMGLSVGSRNQVDMKFLLNKNDLSLKKLWELLARFIILKNCTHCQGKVVVFHIAVVVLRTMEDDLPL